MHSTVGDRAVTVGLTGKVQEIGHTVSNTLDTGRMVFATASIFTGQYFLARIDQKLQTLIEEVEKIVQFLDSSEAADLQTTLNTLREVRNTSSSSLQSKRNQDHFHHQFHDCLRILERNLSVLENEHRVVKVQPPLSWTDKISSKANSLSGQLSSMISTVTPSKRENQLKSEMVMYSTAMSRGLSALQACLCLDVLLDVDGLQTDRSPIAHQLSDGLRRFQSLRDSFDEALIEKTRNSMSDFRFTASEKRRAEFREFLDSQTESVNQQIESAEVIEASWKKRRDLVPETLYCSVDQDSQAREFFLPDQSHV
jgi:hypothetical protein